MKAVTVAVAGAALLTSVSASSHVKAMHARLHQRSDWSDWESASSVKSSTIKDPVTTKSKSWSVPVDLTTTASSSSSSEMSWADWNSTSSTDPATTSKSWSKPVDPATTASSSTESMSWADWESSSSSSSSSKPVDPETTGSKSMSWADWESTSSSSSTPYDPATTASSSVYHWADWSSADPSTPADPVTTASLSWGDWESTVTDPATSADVTGTASESWADWSSEGTSTTTLSSTTTTTIYVEPVTSATPTAITSTVAPGWSKDGWFGKSPFTVDPDMCVVTVVSSYGAPTWYPTADATTPVLTLTVTPTASAESSTSWEDWSSTSEDPATTTSWEDWSSTSEDPSTTTSTYESWLDWTSTSAVATATSTGGWSKPAPGADGFTPNGDSWAMTYSPYTNAGGCKDAGTVAADLKVIASKGFSTVRVYSTDCSTLEHVGTAARNNGLKLILGVFISKTGIAGAKQQVTDIVAWAQWDLVELIVVGNEAVFNGFCSAAELAGFISSSTWAFKGAGYNGKVTTTEPLTTWETQGTVFCGVVDVVAANLYAFFNAQTTADKAGALIQAQISILNGICPGKDSYVMESGWPSKGNCNGVACPSPENQAIALKGIQAVSGSHVVFFSYEDEAWKEPGQFGVEQYWGCAGVF